MNADSRPSRPTLFVTIDMIIHTVRFQSPQRMSLARIIVRNEDTSITRLRARTSPKSHPRTYTHQQPHFSIHLNCEKHTATHGSHLIEQIFKIQNRETSGPLATPPPADTALMPNSGSLCNGQGVQTYVQVRHPSIAVFFELSFSAIQSVHCILLVVLGFFFVEFFAQSPCPLRGGFVCIVSTHLAHQPHLLILFRIPTCCDDRHAEHSNGRAAIKGSYIWSPVKPQSPHAGTIRLPPRTTQDTRIPDDNQDTFNDGESSAQQRDVVVKKHS